MKVQSGSAVLGPGLPGMPEKMAELPFLKQACLNYCLAYLVPGTRETLAGTPEGPFRH